MKSFAVVGVLAAAVIAPGARGQQADPPAPQQSASLAAVVHESAPPGSPAALASVSTEGVSVAAPVSVANGVAFIGNNGAITAGDNTVRVKLTRGGGLNLCATTQVHLSSDTAVSGGGLMIALDRGALEGHYIPGQYSDVILTPDLRILISGPGQADYSLRVNNQGDTCFDNHGEHAPYVLASNLFDGGAYRVQPNQRVLFEHGSVQQVVDNEQESCGCPPAEPTPAPTAIAGLGAPGTTLRSANNSSQSPTATPATTAAENPFPLAESEGLKPPPSPPSTPVVPAGQTHAEVTAPLVYNGETQARAEHAAPRPETSTVPPAAQSTSPPSRSSASRKHSAFVRFFRRLFGRH